MPPPPAELLEFEFAELVVDTEPRVLRRARAANVSNSPAVEDGSIWLPDSVEVKLGTLTLIGFVTTMGQLLLFLALFELVTASSLSMLQSLLWDSSVVNLRRVSFVSSTS